MLLIFLRMRGVSALSGLTDSDFDQGNSKNKYVGATAFFLGGGNSNTFYFHPEDWGR